MLGVAWMIAAAVSPVAPAAKAPQRPVDGSPMAPTWADSWIVVGEDANRTVWYVRAGDMTNSDNYRPTVWILQDHSQDKTTKARTSRSQQAFDCTAGTSEVRTTIGYSAKGKILWTAQAHAASPQPILPATMADILRKIVCPK